MSDDDDPKNKPGSGRRMSWFERLIPARIGIRSDDKASDKGNVPEGLWVKCDHCDHVLYHAELERAQDVCIKCSHHMRVTARTSGSFEVQGQQALQRPANGCSERFR